MIEICIGIAIMALALILLKFIMEIKIKKLKELSERTDLDALTEKLPKSEEMTKSFLKKLKNEGVNIKKSVDDKNETSLYLVLSNTIILGKMENKYARVQTIAHECLHSIQNKKYFGLIIFIQIFIFYVFGLV